jgi:hypothetical protein
MRAPLDLALATAACLAPAVAQGAEAVRRPTFALVLGIDQVPVAGAVVTFAGCLPHLGATAGPQDVQVVAADARGRAQARLLPGLCYVAWAVAALPGADRVAEPVGWFGAGALLELRCLPSNGPRRVRIAGADAWRDQGPLRWFATTPSPGVEIELELVDGALTLPLLPRTSVEVRTADGQPLWRTGDLGQVDLVLPPPQRLPVRVVDEQGSAVAGARLSQRVGSRPMWGVNGWTGPGDHVERDLGTVDQDGAALVTICAAGDLLRNDAVGEALLFARAPGRPAVAGGRYHGVVYVDDHKVARPPASAWTFTLRRAEPLVGDAGVVPAGTVAHLAVVCKLFSGENSYRHDRRTFVVPVMADGRVQFDDVPADVHSCQLTLLPPPGAAMVLPLLTAKPGRALPLDAPRGGAAAARLPACRLELQVVDVHGGPARGAVVAFVPGELDGVLVRDATVLRPLDGGGSATVGVAPGVWHVLAIGPGGWLAEALQVEPGERRERLTLAPLAVQHVRLLDDDGAPVPGARVALRGTRTRATGEQRQKLLLNLQHMTRLEWLGLRTDADGRVAIPFVPIDGVTRRLRLESGERRTDEFELVAHPAPLEVRWR